MHTGLQVKYSDIKFHANVFSGSRIVPRGQTDRQTDRQTDMTKLRAAFLNFAKAPKNFSVIWSLRFTRKRTPMNLVSEQFKCVVR